MPPANPPPADDATQRAIEWLRQRGKVLDHAEGDAITFANALAYQEAVKAKVASGEVFSFNGQNCDDPDNPCYGWDGESRRCSCGNRRVYWERALGFSFENPEISAEAW